MANFSHHLWNPHRLRDRRHANVSNESPLNCMLPVLLHLNMVSFDYDIIAAAVVVNIGVDAPNLFHAKGDADYLSIIIAVRPQCHCTLKVACCRALSS